MKWGCFLPVISLSHSRPTALQALSEEVGDCRRHTGCPGPQELSSTLARLDMQRTHTLERLAAWGVLRAPPPPQQPPQSPLPSHHGTQLQSPGQPAQLMLPAPAQGPRNGTEGATRAGGEGGGASGRDGDGGEELDLELCLAVQLSLQEAEQAGAGAEPMPGGQDRQGAAVGDVGKYRCRTRRRNRGNAYSDETDRCAVRI